MKIGSPYFQCVARSFHIAFNLEILILKIELEIEQIKIL